MYKFRVLSKAIKDIQTGGKPYENINKAIESIDEAMNELSHLRDEYQLIFEEQEKEYNASNAVSTKGKNKYTFGADHHRDTVKLNKMVGIEKRKKKEKAK